MTALHVDSSLSDAQRRARLYAGDIFVCSPTTASLALCQLARELSEDAFAPHDPRTAQHQLDVHEYAEILTRLKPAFIHHPRAKALIRDLFEAFGCDLDTSYFDVPRLRTSTAGGYLTTGIAYAFHPHRDTWYSAPACQVNWWMPVYEVEAGNVMQFHCDYFARRVPNTSSEYDYYAWNRSSRRDAGRHIGTDTRRQPHATVDIDRGSDLRVVAPVGGLMLFSGAHLHSSVENQTGSTRFSIDFRTANLDDLQAGVGAPTDDATCTGTTLRDFLRGRDFERMGEDVARAHDSGDGAAHGDLVYDPNK